MAHILGFIERNILFHFFSKSHPWLQQQNKRKYSCIKYETWLAILGSSKLLNFKAKVGHCSNHERIFPSKKWYGSSYWHCVVSVWRTKRYCQVELEENSDALV